MGYGFCAYTVRWKDQTSSVWATLLCFVKAADHHCPGSYRDTCGVAEQLCRECAIGPPCLVLSFLQWLLEPLWMTCSSRGSCSEIIVNTSTKSEKHSATDSLSLLIVLVNCYWVVKNRQSDHLYAFEMSVVMTDIHKFCQQRSFPFFCFSAS